MQLTTSFEPARVTEEIREKINTIQAVTAAAVTATGEIGVDRSESIGPKGSWRQADNTV